MIQGFTRRGFFALALVAIFAISTTSVSFAAPSETAAVKFIEGLGGKALSSLTDKSLSDDAREKRVRGLLTKYFDVDAIGKFALGAYWRKASATEKKEYLKLFEDMVVKTYAQRFEDYSGQELTVGKAVKASDKDTVVSSKILQKNGPAISLQWRVRGSGNAMKVIDVTVEGISMSVTQRSDFASVIQSGNGEVETLLASLRKRQKS